MTWLGYGPVVVSRYSNTGRFAQGLKMTKEMLGAGEYVNTGHTIS
jgi:hypothetical protein